VIARLKLCIDLGVYAEYFRYSNLVLSILSYCCADILSFSGAFFCMPSNLMCITDELALVHQPVVDRRIYKGGQTPLCSGSNMLLKTTLKGMPPVNIAPLFLSSCDTFICWH